MEKNLYLRWFLDFASIYPAAVLCFAPVLKLMKKPIRTILICFIGITFVCLGSAALCMRFSLSSNGLLLPITNLSFVLYFILLRKQISLPKAAFLFLMATLLTAVSVLLSFIFNARRETENPEIVCLASTSAIALTVEMIICIVYSVFFSKYIRWLILELDSKSVWRMDDTSSIHDFLHFCNADRPFYCFNQSVAKDFSVSGTCFAEFVFYVYVFILSNCKRMQNKYCINQ